MLTEPRFTTAQIECFKDHGFVIFQKAFGVAEAKTIQDWTMELTEAPEEPGRHWVYHETSLVDKNLSLINRIENMTPFHEGFRRLADSLLPSVGQLLGEEAVLFKDKINFKMPGGDGFKPHQDSQAGWEDYAGYFISVLVSIDPATHENGCLQLAPRPETELVGREWEPLTESETAKMTFAPVVTEPGDIIYFDSYAPHMSNPNMTDQPRRLYFATYNRLSEGDHLAAYYADKRKSFPPDIERVAGKEYVYLV